MKDPMFFNKVAGAGLCALLLFFGLPQLAAAFRGGHHGEGHEEGAHPFPQFPIAYATSEAGGAAEPEVDLATLLASADPKAGERRAALCKSCHTLEKGGANSTGPNLWDVVGRPVAAHAGFNYTGALKAAGGEWTFERLSEFIKNSQSYIPGTAMVQHFPNAKQRAEILAYLRTLSDNPVALPEPAPAPAAAEGEAGPAVETPAQAEAQSGATEGTTVDPDPPADPSERDAPQPGDSPSD